MKTKRLPVQPMMCASCPFRWGSPHTELSGHLGIKALSEGSPICHSTGSDNAFHRRTGKPRRLCRGSRDLQLRVFKAIGFLAEATDEAWDAKCKEVGIP